MCGWLCVAGMAADLGRAATLRNVERNVAIIVTTGIGAHFAAELFQCGGLEPFDAACLVAKSPAGFRATYGERAGLMMSISMPGCAPPTYWLPEFAYAFDKLQRPLYPWDEITGLEETVAVFESELALVAVPA